MIPTALFRHRRPTVRTPRPPNKTAHPAPAARICTCSRYGSSMFQSDRILWCFERIKQATFATQLYGYLNVIFIAPMRNCSTVCCRKVVPKPNVHRNAVPKRFVCLQLSMGGGTVLLTIRYIKQQQAYLMFCIVPPPMKMKRTPAKNMAQTQYGVLENRGAAHYDATQKRYANAITVHEMAVNRWSMCVHDTYNATAPSSTI